MDTEQGSNTPSVGRDRPTAFGRPGLSLWAAGYLGSTGLLEEHGGASGARGGGSDEIPLVSGEFKLPGGVRVTVNPNLAPGTAIVISGSMFEDGRQRVVANGITQADANELSDAMDARDDAADRVKEIQERIRRILPCDVCGRLHAGPGAPGVCDR